MATQLPRRREFLERYLPPPGSARRNAFIFIVIAGLDPAIHTESMRGAWVYILASKPRGTLYIGVTNDLLRRTFEHRSGANEFTSRYGVKSLVYFESHATMPLAIQREKNLKHWSRAWKIALVDGLNPKWRDLSQDILR